MSFNSADFLAVTLPPIELADRVTAEELEARLAEVQPKASSRFPDGNPSCFGLNAGQPLLNADGGFPVRSAALAPIAGLGFFYEWPLPLDLQTRLMQAEDLDQGLRVELSAHSLDESMRVRLTRIRRLLELAQDDICATRLPSCNVSPGNTGNCVLDFAVATRMRLGYHLAYAIAFDRRLFDAIPQLSLLADSSLAEFIESCSQIQASASFSAFINLAHLVDAAASSETARHKPSSLTGKPIIQLSEKQEWLHQQLAQAARRILPEAPYDTTIAVRTLLREVEYYREMGYYGSERQIGLLATLRAEEKWYSPQIL